MPIAATAPTAVSATYDQWIIAEFRTLGDGLVPFGSAAAAVPPIRLSVRLVKARLRDDGLLERSPLADVPGTGDARQFEVDDLYAAAAGDADIAASLAAIVSSVSAYAAGRGLL